MNNSAAEVLMVGAVYALLSRFVLSKRSPAGQVTAIIRLLSQYEQCQRPPSFPAWVCHLREKPKKSAVQDHAFGSAFIDRAQQKGNIKQSLSNFLKTFSGIGLISSEP
ncbi:MAG: hypothetical protein AAF703_09120 [Cyanobacteria bacterium P01_D01_bin.105]